MSVAELLRRNPEATEELDKNKPNKKQKQRQRPASAPRSRAQYNNTDKTHGSNISTSYDSNHHGMDDYNQFTNRNNYTIDERNRISNEIAYKSRVRADRIREEAKQKVMEHCTFTPKIKELPRYYNSGGSHMNDMPVEERSMRWSEQANATIEKKR